MNSVKVQHQIRLQKWAGLIKEQQESNLSINRRLKENNISRDQYYYWKRKLKDAVIDVLSSGFVEIPILPKPDV